MLFLKIIALTLPLVALAAPIAGPGVKDSNLIGVSA